MPLSNTLSPLSFSGDKLPGSWQPPAPKTVRAVMARLKKMYPDARCSLNFDNPLQLLVATILSAQCTDERVNAVSQVLFAKYRQAEDFARADLKDLEELIRPTGFFRNKAKSIKKTARIIAEQYKGRVPDKLEELVKLPGVGRKTANVVLGDAFGIPGITVDTHLGRVCRRLGFTDQQDPVKVEYELMTLIPQKSWTTFSHQVIWHGRRICKARSPRCGDCQLLPHCPHGKPVPLNATLNATRKGYASP